MSINAYKSTLRELETPRQIERRILTSLTARMETVADKFDTAESSYERLMILATGLRSALAENQKFWSTLKYDLMESNNALPDDLRARLLSLAIWVEKTTANVLGGSAGVRALISVNTNIAGALTDIPIRESA